MNQLGIKREDFTPIQCDDGVQFFKVCAASRVVCSACHIESKKRTGDERINPGNGEGGGKCAGLEFIM